MPGAKLASSGGEGYLAAILSASNSDDGTTELAEFVKHKYVASRSLRKRGQLIADALNLRVSKNLSSLGILLGRSRTALAWELEAAEIPPDVWALYDDEDLVSTRHTRGLTRLGDEFGWATVVTAVNAVRRDIQSKLAGARYAAVNQYLFERISRPGTVDCAFGMVKYRICPATKSLTLVFASDEAAKCFVNDCLSFDILAPL